MKRKITFAIATLALLTFVNTGALAAAPAPGEMTLAPALTDTQTEADIALIDLNSASVTKLRSLPGIGRAYSKKIVEGRPYKSVDELRIRKILPKGTYAIMHDKVAAGTQVEGDVVAKTESR